MTSSVAPVINSLPFQRLEGLMLPLVRPRWGLPKSHSFALTHPALAQEAQSALLTDPNEGMCPKPCPSLHPAVTTLVVSC